MKYGAEVDGHRSGFFEDLDSLYKYKKGQNSGWEIRRTN